MKTHGLKSLLCRKQYERVTLRWVLNPLLPLLDCFKGRTNDIYFLKWLWASGEKFGSLLCFSNSAPSRPQVSWVRIRAAMTTQAKVHRWEGNSAWGSFYAATPMRKKIKMKKKKKKNQTKHLDVQHKIYDPNWLLLVRERNHRLAGPQMFSIRSSRPVHFLLNVFITYFVPNH